MKNPESIANAVFSRLLTLGAPEAIRTPDARFRKLRYPIEISTILGKGSHFGRRPVEYFGRCEDVISFDMSVNIGGHLDRRVPHELLRCPDIDAASRQI